ncbi:MULTISPECIES: signal peptidase I [Corynebacterium]|uniref:Signal peptidase I n=2 Tax=Corynebacterium flavescens TaxID=28028 RepID=A0A1L7CMM2_CORFL|nr:MULTISPECIES: signal peptidase I [Corynebacterium]APT87102.1 signal peptidase [Corynebacterium flavescens]KAA8721343.1 signal peptidase I [Corynebacterium flavescens]MDN6098986.1 signal peptidase I [Corynebacterium flavescens]MDN6199641.1 signal peptidase I [Corynebacterium flavescens]MDN6226510.1 signal peptidase I [Corynebacterium flavescens]
MFRVNDDSAASEKSTDSAKEKKQLPWLVETFLVVAAVLVVVGLFQNFIGRQYVIPSGSMEPTLHGCTGCTNDRIFTEKISYYGDKSPRPGDVVVFKGTEDWNTAYRSPRSENPVIHGIQDALSFVSLAPPDENNLVKRVVATGGQVVSCQAGDPAVMVDGKPINQDYVMNPPTYPVDPSTGSQSCGGAYFGPITVPEGNIWVMGDNRTASADSRYHMQDEYQGTIPVANVRGKVMFVFYPFNRIGGVDDPDIQAS